MGEGISFPVGGRKSRKRGEVMEALRKGNEEIVGDEIPPLNLCSSRFGFDILEKGRKLFLDTLKTHDYSVLFISVTNSLQRTVVSIIWKANPAGEVITTLNDMHKLQQDQIHHQ